MKIMILVTLTLTTIVFCFQCNWGIYKYSRWCLKIIQLHFLPPFLQLAQKKRKTAISLLGKKLSITFLEVLLDSFLQTDL